MLKKVYFCFILLLALLLAACSSDESQESLSMMEILHLEDKPMYYDPKDEVKEFIKSQGKEEEITIDKWTEDSIWHMSRQSRNDDRVKDFSFALEELPKDFSVQESFDLMYSFISEEILQEYEEPKKTKKISKSDDQISYSWRWQHKDYYKNNPNDYPGNITITLNLSEDGEQVKHGWIGFDMGGIRHHDTLDWDLDF